MKSYIICFLLLLSFFYVKAQDCQLDNTLIFDCGLAQGFVSFKPVGASGFCENQEVDFENTSEPLGYWDYFIIDFGDGTPPQTINDYSNISHTFNFQNLDNCEEGPVFQNSFCFIAVKECIEGITNSFGSGQYLVLLRPVADFDFSQVVCQDEQVSFQNLSCNEDSYAWDFNNDGVIDSNEPNPFYSYSSPGTYSVSLTVTNVCGDDTKTETIEVVGLPEATIDLGLSGGELCAPDFQTIIMNANEWVTGPSGNFNWEISPGYTNMNGNWCFVNPAYDGSGQICLHDSTFTANTVDSLFNVQEQLALYFMNAGEYELTLNYGNTCESYSIMETISVYDPPLISDFSNQSGCDQVEVCFDDLDISITGDYTSVEWVFENGSSPGSSVLNFGCVTFESSGVMTLNVNARPPCMDASSTININVIETQVVSIPNPVPNTICQNDGLIQLMPSIAGGVYEYNGSVASFITDDMLDPSGLDAGNYTVTYVLSDNPECPAADDFNFTIQEGPSIMLGENDVVCDNISDFNPTVLNYGGDIDSWNWTIVDSDEGIVATSSDQNPLFSINASGTYTIYIELASNECTSAFDTSVLVIIATQVVDVPDPVPNVICQNDGLIQLMPSVIGGIYEYNGSVASFITDDMLDPSGLSPGNYTITYVLSTNPECPAADDFSFAIQEGPFITLDENDTVCENIANFNPAITTYGGDIDTWNWTIVDSDESIVATSSDQNPLFSINTPNTYTIYVELMSDECGSVFDTSELIIQANVAIVISPFDNPYCQGSSPDTLSASPLGGMWSGSGIINEEEGIFDPAILAPGIYTITYSTNNGACSASASAPIEVVASENVSVVDTFFCITDEAAQLSVFPTGGEFNGNGIIDANNGTFDPEQANTGNNTITYSYVDANNCEVISNINVEVDTIPILSLNDTVFVCIGNDDIDLSTLVNIDTNGEIGSLTYTGTGIIDANLGIFNGASLGSGFYSIMVSFDARSCTGSGSFVIELAEKPELILSEDATVCITDGSLTLITNIPGGTWSSSNCTIDAETGNVDLASNGETDCVFQYTLSAGTTCEQSAIVNISILDLANDIQVPPSASICYSTNLYTLPNFSPANGTWSGEGIVDTSSGIIDISLLNQGESYTYTYCITSDEVACEACKETVLTIMPLPLADFSLDGSPCQSQSFSVTNNSVNAESYIWNFGDGSPTTTVFEPSHIYTSAGENTITLIALTNFGCRDTLIQQIHVTSPPTLDLVVSTEEGCAPLAIEYVNNSSGEDVIQYWVIDGIDTLFEAQPLIILDSVVTDSLITLTLVVYNGCETLTQSQEILVHPYPIVDFGINDDEGCSPDTVYFMNATLGLPENFLWDFGNGNTSTELNPPPQIYTSPDDSISNYTISLYASNMCGEGLLLKEILVYPNNVDAFFEIDTLSGCPPLAVNIRNYATPGAIITYDFGDGGTGNTGDTTYIYTEPGEYVITQYASLCGTDFIQSDTITVFPLANIDFDLPSYVCTGDSVHFINLSTDGVVSEWHFGDGFISDELNPSHIYNTAGTYEVSLIMNSIYNDCPDTLTKTILIPELPQAMLNMNPGEVCPNELIDFQNESIGAQNFEWNFGDNSGSDQENPSHTYSESGTYEVTLTVFDEFGCSADTTFVNLLVHPVPASSFDLSSDDICQFYDTLNVINTSTGYINSVWNLNGNYYSDQQDDIWMVSEDFGNQNLALISINAFGCRDTSHAIFEVLPSPIALSNFSEATGCQELTLEFIDLSENANLITWILDDNNTSTDSINIHIFEEYGDYNIQLIASNTNGCPSDTSFIAVDVFPRAIANFEMVSFDSCGVPVEIEMINTSELSSDYTWNFGNGSGSSFFAPLAIYNTSGNYEVSLITNNSFGCPDTTTKSITIYPNVLSDFTISNTSLCEGDTLVFTNNSIGANGYEWLLNDEKFDDFPLIITESGQYTLTLIASFNDKCPDENTHTIDVYDAPFADFLAISDESQDTIGDVRFENLSIDAEQFLWEFGDGNTSTEEAPEHEYDINGPVTVCLYAYNNNGGLFQCVDKASLLINYELINTFYVPNAMSPDQNFGNNEVGIFKPKGIDIESYELNIYSPWGDKIKTLNQVFDGEPIDSWDGTFRNKPVPQGAYLWKATIKYKSGHTDFKKGNVTVIR